MPLVDLTWVRDDAPPADTAARLADALAAELAAPPGRLWLRLHRLPRAQYAENGVPAAQTPQPVFVQLLLAQAPADPTARATLAERLSATVAAVLQVPLDTAHLAYAPDGAGRVAFGGVWVGG